MTDKPDDNKEPKATKAAPARRAKSKWAEIQIEYVDPKTLDPDPANPRTIDDDNFARLKNSLREFGFVDPIIARKASRRIIGAHQRRDAAIDIGMERVPVVFLDIDEKRARALNIALNNPKLQGEFDGDKLKQILEELRRDDFDLDLTGFDASDIDEMLGGHDDPDREENDTSPLSLPINPDSTLGAMYGLGPHRLLCGDAQDIEAWDFLFQQTQAKASLLFTEPPTRDEKNADLNPEVLGRIVRKAFGHALANSKAGSLWYVMTHPGPLGLPVATVLASLDVWRQTLIWVASSTSTRSDYRYNHTPILSGSTPGQETPDNTQTLERPDDDSTKAILYGWRPGGSHTFNARPGDESVWDFERAKRRPGIPPMTPLPLIRRAITSGAPKGGIVVDPFAGTGSTLIAAEQTGRVALIIERDPKLCDVIRTRYAEFVGDMSLAPLAL